MALEERQLAAGARVDDDPDVGRDREPGAVGVERRGVGPHRDLEHGRAGGQVEHAHRLLVGPRGREAGAVGAERRTPHLSGSLQGCELLAGRGVPDPRRPVVAGGGQHRPVGAERDVVDVDLVAGEGKDGLARACVADVDEPGLLGALGHEHRPVGAPVEIPPEVGHPQDDARRPHGAVEGLLRLGQRRPVVAASPVDRLERQKHAALGVLVEAGDRGRRELTGDRDLLLVLCSPSLVEGEHAADEGDDEGDRQCHQLHPQPAVGSGLAGHAVGLAVPLLVAGGPAGVEELAGGFRKGVDPAVDLCQRGIEARPAVERPRVPVERVPPSGGLAKLADGDECAAVLFDPRTQPRPGPDQRLVRDLDRGLARPGVAVVGEQVGRGPHLHHVVDGASERQRRQLGAGALAAASARLRCRRRRAARTGGGP